MTSEPESIPTPDIDELPDYPIRRAFQQFYPDYAQMYEVSAEQDKAASLISICKTGKLGYTASYCPECGYAKIRARSCNNRCCPSCQAPLEKKWVMERNAELISGIAYYHVIFTLPHELNSLMSDNQKLLYGLIFSSASGSLITLCRDKKYMGATPGIVSVLHTWGQKLNYHPHLHVCLSGGGLTSSGHFIETKHKGFIIPVRVLGKVFRGKYLAGLKDLYLSGRLVLTGAAAPLCDPEKFRRFLDRLYSKDWLPFVKETFNGNGNAIKYLGRYAYRTAISNSRIEEISDDTVTIRYTDYADHNRKKPQVFSGTEFVREFLQHVLPAGFHRVRLSGFLSNCSKTKNLTQIGMLRHRPYTGSPTKGKKTSELLMMIYGTDISCCPKCRHTMIMGFTARAPDVPITE